MDNGLRRTSLAIVLSLVLLFSSYLSTTVRGQTSYKQDEAPLTVKKDKETYGTGETVTVDGTIQNPVANETIRLDVYGPMAMLATAL